MITNTNLDMITNTNLDMFKNNKLNIFTNIKIKIAIVLFVIIFFTITTYLIPVEEWGLTEFSIYERLIYCSNIQIGTFGFVNSHFFPVSNNAKLMVLIQRITSYIFRIILLI
jgi:hypothetical protein